MRIIISTGMQRKEFGVVEPCRGTGDGGTVGLVMRDYLFVPSLTYANNISKTFSKPLFTN